MRTPKNPQYYSLILFIFVALAGVASAFDYDFVCVDADPTVAPVCNTTQLQSSLPTRVCLYSGFPADYNPYTTYCSQILFDAWISSCPKKNFNLEGFCGGNSYYPYPCFLTPCTTDADCPVIAPAAPVAPVTPCYDCCYQCHDANYCDNAVLNGIYAALGNTSCISCASTTPSSPPVCVGGVVESTGYCNCYSGFTNDAFDPSQACSVPPTYYCQPSNQTAAMENRVVPYISNLHVFSNKLGLNVYSSFVANRTTLIEFPNPECNLINNPSFYSKTFDACNDKFSVNVPFATCGFIKSSNADQDQYRGEMHVKQIDRIDIDGQIVERVIDTPFPIVIRLPKNLAVQSSVEIDAMPVFSVSVLKAAFVGQTVNVATQTGQLEFLTSVPAPLIVTEAQISDTPYGVNASIRFAGSNCSQTGSCLQRLVLDLDVHNCDISGVYRMFVTVGCAAQKNCPSELQNTTASTYLTATIVAQPTCGEAWVDVGLQGSLQAYNDESFTRQTLSFAAGKTAYFLISATSDQVDISNVTLDGVYFGVNNVSTQFLLVNSDATNLAAANNFQWGQHSSSQAWFSFDVTVSSLDLNDNSLFKLNNGESDVYNFVAMVEVEWTPESATPNALPSPSAPSNSTNPFKKRMALQGTLSRQGSQFSSQVQIERTKTQDEGSVSVSSVVSGSILAVSLALLAATL